MDYEDFAEVIVTSTNHARITDEGIWEVSQTVNHRRRRAGSEEWEEKSANVSAFDEDLETAFKHAFLSMGVYLENVDGDLFKEGDEEDEELLN